MTIRDALGRVQDLVAEALAGLDTDRHRQHAVGLGRTGCRQLAEALVELAEPFGELRDLLEMGGLVEDQIPEGADRVPGKTASNSRAPKGFALLNRGARGTRPKPVD